MNICGIVTEYNPMHKGHEYQLNKAKEITKSEGTILVMSGNFVQRGEPALIDKYSRAKAAVATGIDLVLELPVHFSTASAEYFSNYAMKLLDATGVVTHLNFGSESGDIDGLMAIASILTKEPVGYCYLLNEHLQKGLSYPKAREEALYTYAANHGLLSPTLIKAIKTPNNILGVEYIKALQRLDSKIIPTTVKRIGATYHDENSALSIPSATSVRKHLFEDKPFEALNGKLPKASLEALKLSIDQKTAPVFVSDIFDYLKHQLMIQSPESLSKIQDVSEGLENRILKYIDTCQSYEELVQALMTKRYTRTRIARMLLHIYLNHKKSDFDRYHLEMTPYLKVLALSKKGQQILKAIKEANEALPVIVNNRQGYKHLDPLQKECFMADLNSTRLYNHLVSAKYGSSLKNDYQQQIIPQ